PAEPIGTSSASRSAATASSRAGGRVRLATSRGRPPSGLFCGYGGGESAAGPPPRPGPPRAGAAGPPRATHALHPPPPRAAALRAYRAGRVQRVDGPPPARAQAGRAVALGLLGQHGVARPVPGQPGGQELVRLLVTRVPQRARVVEAHLVAQAAQQRPGAVG